MSNLFTTFRTCVSLLPPGFRRRLRHILPMMVGIAVLEMIGLALILPLAKSVAEPGKPLNLPWLSKQPWFPQADGGELMIPLALVVALFYLFRSAVIMWSTWAINRFIMGAVTHGSAALLTEYMAAPYSFHLRHNSAELVQNLKLSVNDVFRSVMLPLLRLMSEGLVVGAIFLVLMVADPVVTLAMSGFVGALLLAFYLATHRRISEGGRHAQALSAQVLQCLNQCLGSIKELRVRRCEQYFVDAYTDLNRDLARIQVFNSTIVELPRLSIETLMVFAFVLAIVAVKLRGGMSADVLPLLAMYALAGFRLMPSFNKLVLYANTARQHAPALSRVLAHRSEVGGGSNSAVVGSDQTIAFRDSIRIAGLRFTYDGGNRPALDGVDLTIRRGQSIGLVGASGSGKTTIVDVLLGLLQPQGGRIEVDGRPLDPALPAWQRQIGYIPQSIYILDDSVRRNVALGVADAEIDDAAVWNALRLAHLDTVVRAMPGGLDSRLGENGALVSGGQRQRIGIARALYHHPQIIVMDEATSALDARTEHEIASAIDELAGDHTMIIVAHRRGTLRGVEVVHLMEAGRIIDCGSLDQVSSRHPGLMEPHQKVSP